MSCWWSVWWYPKDHEIKGLKHSIVLRIMALIILTLIVIALPLIPLVLVRGVRLDRVLFCLYVLTFLSASYFLSRPSGPEMLHRALFLSLLSLLWLNLFFLSQWGVRNLRQSRSLKLFAFTLLPFPLLLCTFTALDYIPETVNGHFYIAQPLYPPLTLLSAVLTVLMLTMGWERLQRSQLSSRSERLFRMGTVLWWLAFIFVFMRMVYTGDTVSVHFIRLLFCFNLLWIAGTYLLIVRSDFLKVRAHPSPQFLGWATQSILVLAVLTLFFWFEALSRAWELPPYSVTLISVVVLAAILLFPLFPFRPFDAFRRILYHHLYLPEQDYALEVALYLKVMRGEETLEKIMDHLRDTLSVDGVALYRTGIADQWEFYLASPNPGTHPALVPSLPQSGERLGGHHVIKSIPLAARDEPLGTLLLLGESASRSFEEESLLRFWSSTLGLLLNELELKEKEQEQEKLAYFSQATSFLLHDAKNLAQLLDLLLKNYHNQQGEDLVEFFLDSMPALEQARTRACRILDKLETFQPPVQSVVTESDLHGLVQDIVQSLQTSMNKDTISFHAYNGEARWHGDPHALRTVVENLVLNSLQADDSGEHVQVNLADDGDSYRIDIQDQGSGIPEEHRAKVFEPFFTTKRGGNGLGLYQARVLVEKMGGKIWFHPNEPHGSSFHVRLGKDPHR